MENRSVIKFITDTIIFFSIAGVLTFLYVTFDEPVAKWLYGEQPETIFVGDLAINVTYAITPEDRSLGLSGTPSLGKLEGKLFFFDEERYPGIWMKDMLFPIDIIWINNDMKIVHIEENVTPDTYPATYLPTEPARFVLETNAFFVDTYSVEVGDKITIPAPDLPQDLQDRLQ